MESCWKDGSWVYGSWRHGAWADPRPFVFSVGYSMVVVPSIDIIVVDAQQSMVNVDPYETEIKVIP